MAQLPEELLLLIFASFDGSFSDQLKSLSHSMRVCKLWYLATSRNVLYEPLLKLRGVEPQDIPPSLSSYFSTLSFVHHLDISGTWQHQSELDSKPGDYFTFSSKWKQKGSKVSFKGTAPAQGDWRTKIPFKGKGTIQGVNIECSVIWADGRFGTNLMTAKVILEVPICLCIKGQFQAEKNPDHKGTFVIKKN